MYDLIHHQKKEFFFWPNMLGAYDEVIVFGAGGRGRQFAEFLSKNNIRTLFFMDNDETKIGTKIDGLDVRPVDAVQELSGNVPVVISCYKKGEVFLQIAPMYGPVFFDFRDNEYLAYVDQVEKFQGRVETDLDLLEDEESKRSYAGIALEVYNDDFRHRIRSPYKNLRHPRVHAETDDVILAIGVNTGNYVIDICQQTEGRCEVHCFEPNNLYFPRLCRNIFNSGYQDSTVLHCGGIWKNRGVSFFSDPFDMARGRVNEGSGQLAIYTWSVDEYVEFCGLRPNLIEIERAGMENVILECGRKTISTFKPRLIIKICPGTSDFLHKLHELVPEYKFYFGDHDLIYKKSLVGFLYATAE